MKQSLSKKEGMIDEQRPRRRCLSSEFLSPTEGLDVEDEVMVRRQGEPSLKDHSFLKPRHWEIPHLSSHTCA